ncbi:MAG: SMC family ATPase, partial [Candidatus Omnitrophica bacterium]|nr:SMC family ATPase [Candidatus Omnitrophota bacterium]
EEMFVEFTFQLNDREYQVYRDYHRKRRTGKLEFRVRENRRDEYILLTGANKRDTQRRIVQTLGLDYRTFVNSSFLQQGKADEFTRQPPKERKEILSAILGLDYYDRLLDEAKKRLAESRAERKSLDEALSRIEAELQDEKMYIEQEKQWSAQLLEQEAKLAALREEAKQLHESIAALERLREQLESNQKEELRIQKRLEDASQRQKRLEAEKEHCQKLIEDKEAVQARYARYEEIAGQMLELLAVEDQFRKLDKERLALEKIIDEQRGRIREQLASLHSEDQQLQKTQAECRPILDDRAAIESNYALYQNTAEQLKRLEEKKPHFDGVQKKISDVESQIERERQKISEEIAELRGSTRDIPGLQKEIEAIQRRITQKASLQAAAEKASAQLQEIVEQGQENNQRKERCASEIDQSERIIHETEEKLDLMQSGQSNECPLCGSSLDRARRESLILRFQDDIARHQANTSRLQKQIKEFDILRESLLSRHQSEEKERSRLERELSRLHLLEADLEKRRADMNCKIDQQQKLQSLIRILEEKNFAQQERLSLETLQTEMERIGYRPDDHAQLVKQANQQRPFEARWGQLQDILQRRILWKNREAEIAGQTAGLQTQLDAGDFARDEKKRRLDILAQIEPLKASLEKRRELSEEQQKLRSAPADRQRLDSAQKRLPELEQDLTQIKKDGGEYQSRLQEIARQRLDAAPQMKQLEALQQQRQRKEADIQAQEKERSRRQIELGGVRQKLDHLKKRREEMKAGRERIAAVERDEQLYKILTTAFSRNGIPAMIVDQALPELENDANNILHRLTNGRCSIALESQRETRSGKISETLDIKISDEMGARNYEMFSGGEAFRTDLALRIALSQLLCRRAGGKLQVLVIDEGFGTQDSEGLAHIVDAVNEIQDDFEKILMVTHLEELKERFQVCIEVTKELGVGSRFEVIHSVL